MSTKGSCIIVGGGPAGIAVARSMAKTCGGSLQITVVDRQDYLDWSVAAPRMMVKPDDIEKFGYAMPLEAVCKHIAGKKGEIQFVQGAVTSIGSKSVTLADGKTLESDAVVVAVGGQYASGALWKPLPDQINKETRIAGFRVQREKLASAKHVLVSGAGPTGVEVAGELKAAFPDTKVTIVGTLLPSSPKSLQTRMKTALEKMGIVVKDGRVDAREPDSDRNVTTRDGELIGNVDMVLNAAGFSFMGKELANDTLKVDVTERGKFKCRPTLQLASVDTVFCCGDILEVPDGKYADVKGLNHAELTAQVVAKNVVLLLSKKPLVDFKWSSTPINKPMMTALGPKVGVGFLGIPNFLENHLCRKLKCKDYYMFLKGSSYGKGKTWK